MGLASGGAFTEMVRKAQLELELHLPNVTFVDAKGLPLEPDGLHLTTPAQVNLGHKLARAFLHRPINSNTSDRFSPSVSISFMNRPFRPTLIILTVLLSYMM